MVDGGNSGNPPIIHPDGIIWHCLSVLDGSHLHVQDESNPLRGLTFPRVDGALPFIKMPCDDLLSITQKVTMNDIVSTLEECERLKKTSLIRSECKRILETMVCPLCIPQSESRCQGIVRKF